MRIEKINKRQKIGNMNLILLTLFDFPLLSKVTAMKKVPKSVKKIIHWWSPLNKTPDVKYNKTGNMYFTLLICFHFIIKDNFFFINQNYFHLHANINSCAVVLGHKIFEA